MRSITRSALKCTVVVDGKTYRIRPTVERVLDGMKVLKLKCLTDSDKARLYCDLLFGFRKPKDKFAGVKAVQELLDEPEPYRNDDKQKVIDIGQDAAAIVAAFRQMYGIDINREAASMDYRTFTALLGGMTDDTMIGYIMGIRARKMPKPTAHNSEERRELLRVKGVYALRSTDKCSFEDGLKKMAEILIGMCEE